MNLSFFEDRPVIEDLDFKLDILNGLKNIKSIDNFFNIMVYGNDGCGKTTKIYALLASLFGKNVYDIKNITFEEDRKTLCYKASSYHIEVDKKLLGSNEKLFITSFLKEYADTRNIGLDIPKIIYFKNANLLSSQSQLSLRKIIEKSYRTAKFIFEVNSISSIVEALRSRFILIRVPMPIYEEVKLCLVDYLNRKEIQINENKIEEIINESCKIHSFINLKKIFGYLRYHLITKNNFKFLYYEVFNDILNIILNQKKISFVTLQKIRESINEMYINLVPMNDLLLFLFNKLTFIYKDNYEILQKLIDITNNCDVKMKKGNKECLHIEYYVISLIELLN